MQRQYCHALTQTLLSRAHTLEVNRALTGMLFELINELVEDLQAPRFLRGQVRLLAGKRYPPKRSFEPMQGKPSPVSKASVLIDSGTQLYALRCRYLAQSR